MYVNFSKSYMTFFRFLKLYVIFSKILYGTCKFLCVLIHIYMFLKLYVIMRKCMERFIFSDIFFNLNNLLFLDTFCIVWLQFNIFILIYVRAYVFSYVCMWFLNDLCVTMFAFLKSLNFSSKFYWNHHVVRYSLHELDI